MFVFVTVDIKAQDIKRQARNMMLKMKSVRTLLAADVPEPKEEVEEELDSEVGQAYWMKPLLKTPRRQSGSMLALRSVNQVI